MNRLRLLLVTDAVGGVWVYSLELVRALKPFAIETVLAVTGPSPTDEQRKSAGDARLIDTGLPLEWLGTSSDEICRAGDELARIASVERADIVQTNSAALLAGGSFDCPTVAVQHSCVATWWDAVKTTPLPEEFEWRRELVARGLDRCGAIIAPSQSFARATGRAYGLERPVLAVLNGRTRRQSRELPQGDFVFTAGRLWDEGKNVATLDRAAKGIGAPVQAAGAIRGPNGASARFDHVVTTGELSDERLGGVLAARPIYASAALYEPFGLSVLEAAQAGCALVLSNIRTHRELWHGAAIFIEPRDERGFSEAINRLLVDHEERKRLGESASLRARRFSSERMAGEMANIYAQLTQPQILAGAA